MDLPPPGHKADGSPATAGRAARGDQPARPTGVPSMLTVGGSLAVVVGLFLVVAWAMRRAVPGNASLLPKEVLEVLGRAPLAARQQVHLLRCGKKLLLVSASPAGVETLTEITDETEVDRLAGLCQQARPDSATAAFRHVLQHFSGQHTTGRNRRMSAPLMEQPPLGAGAQLAEDPHG